MTAPPDAQSRRVLLRCYPPEWRARYGDEFSELLLAELAERPWSWRLTVDVARGAVCGGATRAVRRLRLSPRVLRYETRLGSVAAAAMPFFLGRTSCWVLAGGAQHGTFHAGAIDVAGLAVMLLALAAAWRAMGRARRAERGI